MFRNESKLTKWSLAIMAVIFTAYFSTSARSAELDDIVTFSAMCAVVNEAAVQEGLIEYADDATWWTRFMDAWLADEPVDTETVLFAMRKEVRDDAGLEIIAEGARACEAAKDELITLANGDEET